MIPEVRADESYQLLDQQRVVEQRRLFVRGLVNHRVHRAVVPLVIAIGWRAPNAHLEPQWRRPFEEAVVVH